MFRLHLYAAVQIFVAQTSHSGPRVPVGHPVFPALSFKGGEATEQSSGEVSREDDQLCLTLKNGVVPRTLRSTK